MASSGVDNERVLRDLLIDRVLVVSGVGMATAYAVLQVRSWEIGWTSRDVLQALALAGLIAVVMLRHRLGTSTKAACLVLIFAVGAIPGVYTLGMLGGTILLFPSTICLIAVFYSARVTVAAIVASLCFGLLVALRFCAGGAMDAIGRHLLMTRPSHWAVYLLTLTVCLAVISVTVFSYRRAVRSLIEKITLQRDELERANQELRNAARNVRTLRGLIPICASCKRIRDDEGYWRQIETYVRDHSEADFSHGICPACLEKLYGEGKGGNESEGDGSTA